MQLQTDKTRWSNGRIKHVAYNRDTKMYLRYDCTGETPDRNYAWVGTAQQARNMVEVFPLAANFVIYRDGEERE